LAVHIRLRRVGKTKAPTYRVVIADSRAPRNGKFIESIGHYNPRTEPSEVVLDVERAEYWIGQGAQPSDQVRKLISIAKGGDGAAASAPAPQARPRKATPAASVDEASVADETEGQAAEAAEVPEATDQASAAPDADVTE
jgi:small subunit ribosomal protein S16